MEIFLYALIFITGIFFGSFFTLAVYRIPRKEDILIKHSYCPNCNHKLGFFDLFPVFSYIFLGGKCRYCGNRIRPRYLILELLSGITFVLVAISLKININDIYNIINIIFVLIYISILFIIAGIDKEKNQIQKNVIFVGYIAEIIYIIYQCTLGNINVYQYVIYLILLIIILLLSSINIKNNIKSKYYIDILYLALYMIILFGSKIYIITSILTLLIICIYQIISKQKKKKIPVGFYMCISNIITIVLCNVMANYMI